MFIYWLKHFKAEHTENLLANLVDHICLKMRTENISVLYFFARFRITGMRRNKAKKSTMKCKQTNFC